MGEGPDSSLQLVDYIYSRAGAKTRATFPMAQVPGRQVYRAAVPAAGGGGFAGASLFEWYAAAAGPGGEALVAPPGGASNPFTVVVV